MKDLSRFYSVIAVLILLLALPVLSGQQVVRAQSGAESTPEAAVETLKFGLLPVLDTLPFYIAEENGYFEEAGVMVEGIPVSSPVERDQLMQAGEIDGMLNEITSTAVFNRDQVQIEIVSAARIAAEDGPVFRILAAPSSNIQTPADLAGVPIGVSLNTVIEYVTERILQEEGLSPDEIVPQSVPAIPERFQLLMQGQLEAATLPDPLAQAAMEAGAKLVIDDSAYPFYSVSVLSFSVDTLENKPEAVKGFMTAWNRAVEDLNANPEDYRDLFLEKVSVPDSVKDTYEILPFPLNQVPSEEQWADVIDWLLGKGLLESTVSYADSVTTDFLTEIPQE